MSLHQRERPDRLSFEPKYKKQEEKVFMFVPPNCQPLSRQTQPRAVNVCLSVCVYTLSGCVDYSLQLPLYQVPYFLTDFAVTDFWGVWLALIDGRR